MPRLTIPANTALDVLAPKVAEAARRVIAGMAEDGFKAVQFDTLRTAERQAFLFGKGRTPEQCQEFGIDPKWAWPLCPDGVVTGAARLDSSWHGYGLAVDIVENDQTPWVASQAFWAALGRHATLNGLRRDIKVRGHLDLPHCQWGACPTSPTPSDRLLLSQSGLLASWVKYNAL